MKLCDIKLRNERIFYHLDDPSSLRLFFRSLLPNFNPEEPLPPPGEAQGGAEGGVDLRNSVQSLVGALRDLLGNIEVDKCFFFKFDVF